jgi:large subunit ribosomal protein L1
MKKRGLVKGPNGTKTKIMSPYSARYNETKELVDASVDYNIKKAIQALKATATAKFPETAEFHANLNLNPKYNDQQIRTTVSLPHGVGKSVRVAVLAEGDAAAEAEAAGADIIGFDDLVEDISNGKLDFEVLIATPPAMPKIAKLGKMLGPKGLMPSPKAGTVTANPGAVVKEYKAGKLEFRTDKSGCVHIPFGKAEFGTDALEENLSALIKLISDKRPTGCKGRLWKSATVAATMGPAIPLNVKTVLDEMNLVN